MRGILVALLVICGCQDMRSRSPFGSGTPDPNVSSEKDEKAKSFGVFGQRVKVVFEAEKTKAKEKCLQCGNKTDVIVVSVTVNGRDVAVDVNKYLCGDHCVKFWLSQKYLGFDVDEIKRK